jgi:hypothetical protein
MKFNFIEKKAGKIPESQYPKVTSVMGSNDRYDENDPKDFFDFSNGVPLTDEEKQHYIKQVMDYLNEHPEAEYCCTGTGNCMVIAFNRLNEVDIMVVEKYMEATVKK